MSIAPNPVLTDVSAPAHGPSIARRVWLAAAMLLVGLKALPVLTYPLGRDQATYLLIGKGLMEGKALYRDLWDNKPPGIFLIYGPIAEVLGKVMWSAAVVDILWLFIISFCIFRFTERYAGSAAAAVAVATHACWHVAAGYIYMGQPEAFQALFVLAGFFLMAWNGRWQRFGAFAAGLSLGAACWLKYNAVGFLPFLLFVPFLDLGALDGQTRRLGLTIPWRDWFGKAGVFLAGLASAIGLVLVWIWLTGAWPAMKEIQFEVLPRYGLMGVQSRTHYWLSVAIKTRLFLGVWTEVATLAGLVIAWRRRDLARFAPLLLGALSAYASTALQLRLHDYYFQACFPFFAMVWGYVALNVYEGSRAVARKCAEQGWRVAAVLVWLVFANLIYWPLPQEFDRTRMQYEDLREWRTDRESFYSAHPWQIPFEHIGDQMKVIRYLRRHSSSGDGMFLWGAHELIYYFSDLRPPTRFVSNLGLLSLWVPPSWRTELMRDLDRSPPRFVVVARRDALPSITYVTMDSEEDLRVFPQLKEFIDQHYRLAADFDSFVVYWRKDPGVRK